MVRKPSSTRAVSRTSLDRKKNAPYLYDLMITHALDWPSLTCQWFPDKETSVPSPPKTPFSPPSLKTDDSFLPLADLPTNHTRPTDCC
jgi:Histone-binding protein RBBP4 or subunit C of CAF1 complex